MTPLTAHDRECLRNDLYEAQEHLREAISLLERYVDLTGDRYAEAYLIDHLKIYTGRDHGFLSRDPNIDELIERLDNDDEDEAEADEPAETAADGRTLYWSDSLNRYVSVPQDDAAGQGE